jgi:hypothetical protein
LKFALSKTDNPVEPFHISYTAVGDLLRVTVTGEFSLENSKRNFLETLQVLREYRLPKVLFDGSKLTGEPTTMDRFHYGEFIASEFNKFVIAEGFVPRFAYVIAPPVIDPQRFGENVAVNRGMNARIFDNFSDAYQWLEINDPLHGMKTMKLISNELAEIISAHAEKLKQLNDGDAAVRSEPGKWSRKEELGHLIDSAHNNLRRFIVSQYEHEPHIIYAQDEWVKVNDYNSQVILQLTRLWLVLNQQIVQVLSAMNDETSMRKCNTGKDAPVLHDIRWLAEDYILHLRHHLHHILDLEPVSYG